MLGLGWLLVGLMAALVLAWSALYLLILPRIADFRPDLEAAASRALGVPVHIGQLSARQSGWVPSFDLNQVTLLDREGRVALSLPQVELTLSPRSLLRLGFERITLFAPTLNVRRTVAGDIEIAGLRVASTNSDERVADWLASQARMAVADGTLVWTDEQQALAPVVFNQVNLLIRNSPIRHSVRVEVSPPTSWGDRFSILGDFRQPLLDPHRGHWQAWKGTVYANFDRVDMQPLRPYLDLGRHLTQGHGALRFWADLAQGQVSGGVVDLAMSQVQVKWREDLPVMDLKWLQGRLGGQRLSAGVDAYANGLTFESADGLRWPGGRVALHWEAGQASHADAFHGLAHGELSADQIDVAALSALLMRVPVSPELQEKVQAFSPKGQLESVHLTWLGDADPLPAEFKLNAQLKGVSWQATNGVPGVQGLDAVLDTNQNQGQARLSLSAGALALPDFFDEPQIPITQLQALLKWQIEAQGQKIRLQVPELTLTNADLKGQARLDWHTDDRKPDAPLAQRLPGVLNLQGSLSRGEVRQVARYLPKSLPADTRQYVKDSLSAGSITQAQFQLQGRLNDFPFKDNRGGLFKVQAQVKDGAMNLVPASLTGPAVGQWPLLSQINAQLDFQGQGLVVRANSAKLVSPTGGATVPASAALVAAPVEVRLPDFDHPVVTASSTVKGSLNEMLRVVAKSPVADWTDQILSEAQAIGPAELRLKLTLPLEQMARSKVQGSVILAGNELKLMSQVPRLSKARGTLSFSESSLSLANVQAQALGGEVKLEGGLNFKNGPAQGQLRVNGQFSAEGLRQAPEFKSVSKALAHATGGSSYALLLNPAEGGLGWQFDSSLQGLALDLPEPLGKAANTTLPVHVERRVFKTRLNVNRAGAQAGSLRDRLQLKWGDQLALSFTRDLSGAVPKVLQGRWLLGNLGKEPSVTNVWGDDRGVMARINLPQLNLDRWSQLDLPMGSANTGSAPGAEGVKLDDWAAYLPSQISLVTPVLVYQSRTLNNLTLSAQREPLESDKSPLWRAKIEAKELAGTVEYRPTSGASGNTNPEGRIYARLTHLKLAKSTQTEVETLLSEQPVSMPDLDIVVDNTELRGLTLGRVEVLALNRANARSEREWRLDRFNMTVPEASFVASGQWLPGKGIRQTQLNFKLDIKDAGKLLERFGLAGQIASGHGKLEGDVLWQGSPMSFDEASLGGNLKLNVENGQFLKTELGSAKLLSVLSLQSLPRRLSLDFRDVFSDGFSFDSLRGDVAIEKGMASTRNLQMRGVNAVVLMEGQVDIPRETQHLTVVVIPEINAGTASLLLAAVNPVIGLGSFVAQYIFRRPFMAAATKEFLIDGTWADPRVEEVAVKAGIGSDETPAKN